MVVQTEPLSGRLTRTVHVVDSSIPRFRIPLPKIKLPHAAEFGLICQHEASLALRREFVPSFHPALDESGGMPPFDAAI
jgi:hypothetical protein